MAIDLTEQSTAVVAPVGTTRLQRIAGALKVSTDGSAFATVGGSGAVAPWFTTVSAFIQGLQPTLLAATLATECQNLALELEASTAAGSGTCVVDTANPGGIIKSASGATGSSYRYVRNRSGAAAPVVSNTRTAKYACANRVKVVQVQATFAIDLCGFTDESTLGTTLGCLQAVSAVNYVLKVGSHAGQNLGVAFSLGTWVTLAIIADGTNITAYLGAADGSGLTQMGSPQAQVTSPSAVGAWLVNAQNLGTAANVEAHVDAGLVLTERTP